MPELVIDVEGVPMPKGSKTAVVRGDRAVLLDARRAGSRASYAAWCSAVDVAARAEALVGRHEPLDGHLVVRVDFYLPRPARTRVGARPAGKPALDKLYPAVHANLGALIPDDARVVDLSGAKWWATDDRPPGARIQIGLAESAAA
ncbi:MAG: hypothetical protein AAGA99_21210 [Actinomycetota bacterium]